jgi:hypothetical protein
MRLAVLAFAALLLLPAVPAQAAHVAPDAWVAWFRSDGASGISPARDVLAGREDSVVDCAGVSPGQDTCTLVNTGCGTWIPRFCAWVVGWEVPPPLDPTTGLGGMVGSTSLTMTGTYAPDARLTGTCDWATLGLGDQFEAPPAQCSFGGVDTEDLAGALTATFSDAFYDLHGVPYVGAALPGTAGLGPAVGSWHAFLLANFAG